MDKRKKLFIVEGPDGAGKTTLIKQLVENLKGPTKVIHHGPYLDESAIGLYNIYLDSFVPDMQDNKTNVILDRSWISEVIYGEVVRNTSRVSAKDLGRFASYMEMYNGMYISCMPPLEVCIANYAARKEIEYLEDETTLAAVYGLYNHCNFMGRVFYHDYTKTSVHDLISVMKSVKTLTKDDLV